MNESVTLGFAICGLEHSGTTLVSDLFRQVDDIEAGFEVGALICESPRNFVNLEPYSLNILGGWQISRADLEHCCDTDQFDEFYRRLCAKSPLIGASVERTFDKTPRYLSCLSCVLTKVSVPFIVTYKDPRATVYSDYSRAKAANFDEWYNSYKIAKLKYVRNLYSEYLAGKNNERVHMVRLEELCVDTLNTCRQMFNFLSLPFALDYLLLKDLRYKHTRDSTVSPRIALEYREKLSRAQQQRIESDFSQFSDWFFEA